MLFEILLYGYYGFLKKDDTFVLGILEIIQRDEMALGCSSNFHYWCSGSELGHH